MKPQFFSHGEEGEVEFWDTAKEAMRAAEGYFDYCRDRAAEGWHENVELICWGEVRQGVIETRHLTREQAELEGIHLSSEVDDYVEYALLWLPWVYGEAWKAFQDAGLLFAMNKVLHLFGWSLVTLVDEESSRVEGSYPMRTPYRGFTPEIEDEGFRKLHGYLAKEMPLIRDETDAQEKPK